MQIILIRHGKAEHQTTTDANRSLTTEGESQAQQTAARKNKGGKQTP